WSSATLMTFSLAASSFFASPLKREFYCSSALRWRHPSGG
ncbi:Transcriptional regulator, LysR family, partial [Pseudomonas sp. FG-3G]